MTCINMTSSILAMQIDDLPAHKLQPVALLRDLLEAVECCLFDRQAQPIRKVFSVVTRKERNEGFGQDHVKHHAVPPVEGRTIFAEPAYNIQSMSVAQRATHMGIQLTSERPS